MEYLISGKEKGRDIYYTVIWSPITKAERYDIISKVPALAGIFEVYWMDDSRRLRLFYLDKIIYGGLRSELRRITDPELCVNNDKIKKILEEKEIYYRYSLTDSAKVMDDVIWFFMQAYFPDEEPAAGHSGRYENIFLKEGAPDKLLWVP